MWNYSSLIFDLGTTWRRVISFTLQPFYPQKREPWYPPKRRLGDPRDKLNAFVEKKTSFPYWDSKPGKSRP
jgi:hypothetical protein